MIARRRTDLPVPAEPVKKKDCPLRMRSRIRVCRGESGGSVNGGGSGRVACF